MEGTRQLERPGGVRNSREAPIEEIHRAPAFVPRYLSVSQIEDMYRSALAQLEVSLTNAWINCRLAPEDPARDATYRRLLDQRMDLEADLARVLVDDRAMGPEDPPDDRGPRP